MMKIPETDTSTVRTMTVLRNAQSGINIGEGRSKMYVDPVGFVQSSRDFDMNA